MLWKLIQNIILSNIHHTSGGARNFLDRGQKMFLNIITKLYKNLYSTTFIIWHFLITVSLTTYLNICFVKIIEKYLFQPITILIKLRMIKPLWCIFMSLALNFWPRDWQSFEVKYLCFTLSLWLWWCYNFFSPGSSR